MYSQLFVQRYIWYGFGIGLGYVLAIPLTIGSGALLSTVGAALPPVAILLPGVWFHRYGVSLELLVGVLLHSSLFLLFNVYLFRRYRRHRVFSSWRACAPTLWGLALVLGLDVAYWAFALTSSPVGIAHQGMTYLIVYGALNVLVFLGATGVLWGLVRQARRQQTTIAPLSLLTLHFCIYLAGLTILFPYIGELP